MHVKSQTNAIVTRNITLHTNNFFCTSVRWNWHTMTQTVLSWKKTIFRPVIKHIYCHKNRYKSVTNPWKISVSSLWLDQGRNLLQKGFLELLDVFWSDRSRDLSHNFSHLFLRYIYTHIPKDSSNYRKIGDWNKALQICKQSTQKASV